MSTMETSVNKGFKLELSNGRSLQAVRVEGHDKPWLVVVDEKQRTKIAVAEFISDEDANYVAELLQEHVFIIESLA